MTGYDVDPAGGVRGVVDRTAARAGELEDLAKKYVDDAEAAHKGVDSPIVANAVAGFVAHHEDSFTDIVRGVKRALRGTVDAVGAYVSGDDSMAEDARRAQSGADSPPERQPRPEPDAGPRPAEVSAEEAVPGPGAVAGVSGFPAGGEAGVFGAPPSAVDGSGSPPVSGALPGDHDEGVWRLAWVYVDAGVESGDETAEAGGGDEPTPEGGDEVHGHDGAWVPVLVDATGPGSDTTSPYGPVSDAAWHSGATGAGAPVVRFDLGGE